MAFGKWADQQETDVLRAVFGDGVREVVFYDAEDPRDGFELAVALDVEGHKLGELSSADPRWDGEYDGGSVGDIPRERGETVKFFLMIAEPADNAP